MLLLVGITIDVTALTGPLGVLASGAAIAVLVAREVAAGMRGETGRRLKAALGFAAPPLLLLSLLCVSAKLLGLPAASPSHSPAAAPHPMILAYERPGYPYRLVWQPATTATGQPATHGTLLLYARERTGTFRLVSVSTDCVRSTAGASPAVHCG